jgi:hypothetical protein
MRDQIKFSCLACGQHIVCDASESGRPMLCPGCGANLTVPRQMHQEPPSPFPQPETPVPEAAARASARTSGLAVASLICSLSSLVLCVGWLPGIICGHLAKARIRRDPTLKGRSLATAGLIISYATLLFAIGLAASAVLWGSAIFKNAYQQAEQIMATNKIVSAQVQTQPETVSNNDEQVQVTQATSSAWTMDVKDAQIPDSPVSGQIHGQNFAFKRAIFHAGNLRFTSANGAEYVLIHGLGQDIANNTFEVDSNSTGDSPKVEIAWGENGQKNTQNFASGYALELKFDPAQKRKVHGHIYLCLPDDSKSYLVGAFTATLPKPKAPKTDAQ